VDRPENLQDLIKEVDELRRDVLHTASVIGTIKQIVENADDSCSIARPIKVLLGMTDGKETQ